MKNRKGGEEIWPKQMSHYYNYISKTLVMVVQKNKTLVMELIERVS